MKLLSLKQGLCVLGGLLMTFSFTGCGNTMYGMGLDMERVGRKLQGQHDPDPGAGYQQAPTGSGTYYSPQGTTPGTGGYN